MSKAFVKDDGDDDGSVHDDDAGAHGVPAIPEGVKNYITPKGFERMRAELHELLHVTRPELVRTVAWAASNGDRSENADYIYGKRRLREIDRRIRFLSNRLDRAEVVDPAKQRSERVLFGATVRVIDEEGRSRTYVIVGVDEIDAARGRVSWLSPVAKALLSAKVGETVTLRTPRGETELEVASLEYLSVD